MNSENKRLGWLPSILTTLSKALDKLVISLNAMGTLLIILMMILICADVVGRNLLNSSLPGVVELTELGIVSVVFLQISDALREGRMMRSDGLLKMLVRRLPRTGYLVNAIFDATGAGLFFFISKGGFGRFAEAWDGDFYIGNQGAFTAPIWPMELAVAVGAAVMTVLFCTTALRHLSHVVWGKSPQDLPHLSSK
ncbi:TRAP transporter small permease [Planktotalea sp.]|uniref:TRAP transporter small permease n=1 Tax=Planktotalea sp. TaxID=2029877 RepID=UPI0032999EE0